MSAPIPSMIQLWKVFDGTACPLEYIGERDVYSKDEALSALLNVLSIDPQNLSENSLLERDIVYDFLSQTCCSGIQTIEDLKAEFDIDPKTFSFLFYVVESVWKKVPRRIGVGKYIRPPECTGADLRQIIPDIN